MPELPEVETIRRDLAAPLLGRRIERVRVHEEDLILGGTSRRSFQRAVRGRRFGGLERRAKFLLFPLLADDGATGPERLLRVQLRMTGQFALDEERPRAPDFRHPGVDFGLDDGRTLFYDDVRRLGGFDLLTPERWTAIERRLGPEPLSRGFTDGRFGRILAPLRAPIKNALLDQRRIAGVGNIYASEALFRAHIDPRAPAGTLDPAQVARLRRAIRTTLAAALERAGTTIRDYRAVNGRSGSYQSELDVYGREGAPCRRCEGPIIRLVQAGRSTFFCEDCQGAR
ncbi:MAG: bifunctional DNA-formamidopyrimidine glycosylase/DNA-(apurinic or apyrimidinic site) lyase [Gemmatimonadetes bacterium]|nr:bifunctional DNA-formamidopyrimidine glycosylase/DNA-(apurinic or apyrimidinic site) lyase [Gemmatimonadota bacterium]